MLVFSEHLDALAAKPPSTHPPRLCAAGLKFPPRSDLIPGELYTTCTWGPRNRASFPLFRISRAGRPVSTSLLKLPHLIYSLTVTALIKENIALLDNNMFQMLGIKEELAVLVYSWQRFISSTLLPPPEPWQAAWASQWARQVTSERVTQHPIFSTNSGQKSAFQPCFQTWSNLYSMPCAGRTPKV